MEKIKNKNETNETNETNGMKVLADYYVPEARTGYVDGDFKTVKCPYCGEIHEIKFHEKSLKDLSRKMDRLFNTNDIEEIINSDLMNVEDRISASKLQAELKTLKCPSCGKVPSGIDEPGHFNSGATRFKVLLNGDVLHLRTVYSQRYSFPESRKVKVKPYVFDVCVNLRTGLTYEAPVHSLGRKFSYRTGTATALNFRVLAKKACKLKMITSRPTSDYPFALGEFFNEEIDLIGILDGLGYNTSALKKKVKTTENKFSRGINVVNLAAWNYSKNVDQQIAGPYYAELDNSSSYGRFALIKEYRSQYSILKKKDKEGDLYRYINNVCKRRKLGKRIKKLFYLDWRAMCLQKELSKIGVKDQNYVYQLLTANEAISKIPQYVWEDNYRNFLTELYNVFGEKKVVSVMLAEIESSSYSYFYDTTRMYEDCLTMKATAEEIAECMRGKSIKDIHDNLSALYDAKSHENIELKYTQYERTLEENISGYQFKLAADTGTLRDAGRRMNICVGSYDKRALSKQCTIVLVKKDGKHEICIELVYDAKEKKYAGVQFKACYNQTVEKDAAVAMMVWVKKHDIDVTDCYDYERAERYYDDYKKSIGEEAQHKAEIINLDDIEVDAATNLLDESEEQCREAAREIDPADCYAHAPLPFN